MDIKTYTVSNQAFYSRGQGADTSYLTDYCYPQSKPVEKQMTQDWRNRKWFKFQNTDSSISKKSHKEKGLVSTKVINVFSSVKIYALK